MKHSFKIIAAGVLLLALTVSVPAMAGKGNAGNPGVLPPQSHPNGKTYGEWSAAWWQWALGQPADVNPLLDETGANAAQGQSGPVWFLCGVWNSSGQAERSIAVPPGKALFFPIINFMWISTVPEDPQTAEGIREIVKPPADAVDMLECEVDGVALKNLAQYRTESPLFDVFFPAGDIYGIGPATYGPSMDEGYYIMLAPLSAGKHTIHFYGNMPETIPPYWSPFSVDVTYHITVGKPKK